MLSDSLHDSAKAVAQSLITTKRRNSATSARPEIHRKSPPASARLNRRPASRHMQERTLTTCDKKRSPSILPQLMA